MNTSNIGTQVYCVRVKSAGTTNMEETHDNTTILLRVKAIRENRVVYPGAGFTPVAEVDSESTNREFMDLEYRSQCQEL
jgi:hypothetical protein